MEHYFKNKHKSLLGLIMPVFGMIFLGLIFFLVSYYIFTDLVKFETLVSITISAVLVVLVMIIFIYRIVDRPDYIVTNKGVLFKKRDKIIRELPYEKYMMSSYVVRNSYNGIPTGTSRQLIADDGKKEKKYVCALTKKNFDEFMSLIIAYSGNAETNSTAKETPNIILSEVNKDFFLDKNRIFRNIAFKKYFGLIFASFLLLALFFLLTYFGERDSWFFLAGMAVCLLIYFFLVLISLGRTKRKMPENIKLRTNEISLDEERFNFNEISKISLTPPSYYVGNINRNLKIYRYDGKKKTYILGFKVSKAGKKDKVFSEYEEFFYMLEGILGNSPGKFQYDL